MDMAVEKVYPKIEELTIFNNKVSCLEEGCSKIFSSESNLTLHLVKSHKKHELWSVKKEYYCPEKFCVYNKNKGFKSIKPLKQHYMKVHMKKSIECGSCNKCFVSELVLKSHQDYCGVKFKCYDCKISYDCYETLKTHCRRKKHAINEKKFYKTSASNATNGITSNLYRLILPKPGVNVNMLIYNTEDKIMLNQSSQTDSLKPKLRSKSIQVQNLKVDTGTQIPNYTQTSFIESHSNETQTAEESFSESQKHSLDCYNVPQKRKSIKVQTTAVPYTTSSCNTSFDLNDFEFTINSDIEKFSSSTQTSSAEFTNNYSSSTTTHDSIHTDTSDLLMYGLNENLGNYDASFFNCNMETQTDLILQNDDLFNYCDYYSNNMYTQTCNDILSDVVFNDTETQTKIDEMFNSVESQTIMSHTKPIVSEDKYVANMETQTDTEFQIKLEEINS